MLLANKICVSALCLLHLLEFIDAQKQCKVPNGDGGTCIQITKCQPLLNLEKKKFKTRQESMFLRQSNCGIPSLPKPKVCCPSPTLWSKFEANPVLYPKSPSTSHPPTSITNKPVTDVSGDPSLSDKLLAVPVLETIPADEDNNLSTRDFSDENLKSICGPETSGLNKIIGGNVTAIDQYPWMALLEYSFGILACGGSLISPRFVLTAAHCINGRNGNPVFVRLAEFNTTSFPTDSVETDGGGWDNITVTIVKIKDQYVHPKYRRIEQIHDIALVELATSARLDTDFIKIICLPDRDFRPYFNESTNFEIAGWGDIGSAFESEVKRAVEIPYVPWDKCEKVQEASVMNTQICAGGVEGKDSCKGDSGGPLMYLYEEKYYAVGLISYGHPECGKKGAAATHTNVFHYITWIKEVITGRNRN